MKYELHNDIKTYRRGRINMAQQNLADCVGCTRQTIAVLEKQKYNPSLMLALKISEILEVSVEKLFRIGYL